MNANDLISRLQLPFQGRMPEFEGATEWWNSPPLTAADLEGKVVAVDFWTYTCINWLRTLPYLRAWDETYRDQGLVIVGVHTPEFDVEHDIDRVRDAAREMDIRYPIAIDNDYAVWNAFANQYWPALYVVDGHGRIRHHVFGESGYDRAERVVRKLLEDAGASELPDEAPLEPHGFEIPADWHSLRSPETYVGVARAQSFASPERVAIEEPREYTIPDRLRVNEWALAGRWTLGREEGVCTEAGGRIAFRFHARDLHLILAPPASGTARFRIRLDGASPGDAHGLDVDADGNGVITEARLHQLVRQSGSIEDRVFEIELLDPGAAALCFTFG